jgi:hypothetical protein
MRLSANAVQGGAMSIDSESPMNVFKAPVNRRQLLRGGAALGATTLVPSFLLSACGGSSAPTNGIGGADKAARESQSLNFDLSAAPIASPRLHLQNSTHNGAALIPHTAESRAAQRKANPRLALVPDDKLTHYLPAVDLPASALQVGWVMGKHSTTGADVLALQFLHVPTSSLNAVAAKRAKKPLQDQQPPALAAKLGATAAPTALPDVIGQYSPPTAVALSLVFQHPAITNLDPDLGGDIVDRIKTLPTADTPYLNTLATKIGMLIQTGGWPSTTSTNSWCVMVPRVDSSGQPVLDDSGNQIYSYNVNPALSDATADVVKAILNNINNDTDFQGTNWQPPTGAPQQTAVATAVAAAWNSRPGVADESPFTVRHSLRVGSRTSGIRLKAVDSTSDRVVTLTVANEFLRSAGAYVEFRDANETTLPVATPTPMDTSRAKYICLIAPDVQIMGIPFVGSTTPTTPLTFTMPDNASKAIVYYGGLGLGGSDAFHGEALMGSVSTLVLNIGLPAICLAAGVGVTVAKGIKNSIMEAMYDTKIATMIIQGVSDALSAGLGTSIQSAISTVSLSSFLSGIGETILDIFFQCCPRISLLWYEAVTASAAANAIPIIGAAMWALSTAADIATIGETIIECLCCPAIDSNTISLGMDQSVSISRDPAHYEFPATATKVRVVATYDGGKVTNIVEQAVTMGTVGPLNVYMGNVASGGHVSAAVTFYDDNDTIVGYGASESLKNFPDTAGTIPVTIKEVLVPLTSSTSYQHAAKLTYQGGAHAWQATSNAPTQTITSLKPGADGVLTALYGVTLNTASGNAGYGFAAGGQGIGVCGTGSSGSPAGLRNVFLGDNPDSMAKFSSCGASQPMGICYDPIGNTAVGGNNFFLQPGNDGFYYLRSVSLDTSNFDMAQSTTWGRFMNPQDSMCVLSNGFVVGCNRDTHKMEVLMLPQHAYPAGTLQNDAVPFSALKSGYGSLPGRLDTPVAVAAFNDKVLVLEQGNKRVQAFDQDGSTVNLFSDDTGAFATPVMQLKDDGDSVTYLDIAVEGKGYIYVLSCTNGGASASSYNLDVYTPAGAWLCRTNGVSAGAMAVDLFRNLVTLNYETVAGAPQVEPSLSQWLPRGSTASAARVHKAVRA